nr:hypothetical protein [Tanacetum cinerariifolium]
MWGYELTLNVDVSEESNSESAIKQTSSRRVIKKKVSNSTDDNIILEPGVTLELGKSMSLAKAIDEEAARQVNATHERIVTESDPELARRRPSCITFRDTSEKLVADTMQALKASRKSVISQSLAGGSSEGTDVSPGVPDKSTVIHATSSERTRTKPGVPDKEKGYLRSQCYT